MNNIKEQAREISILMTQNILVIYHGSDGCTLQREYGSTPNGNAMAGRWVLRDTNGTMIDFDQYRNDIAERNNLELEQAC